MNCIKHIFDNQGGVEDYKTAWTHFEKVFNETEV